MKFLVVEDEPAIRQVIVQVIWRLGHETLEAENAEEALSHIEEAHFIITDWRMGAGMSGLDLIRLVRAREAAARKNEVPILLISGTMTKGDMLEALKAGAHGCLEKPFSIDPLRDKIEEILKQAR